jgi:hypothetical protein
MNRMMPSLASLFNSAASRHAQTLPVKCIIIQHNPIHQSSQAPFFLLPTHFNPLNYKSCISDPSIPLPNNPSILSVNRS